MTKLGLIDHMAENQQVHNLLTNHSEREIIKEMYIETTLRVQNFCSDYVEDYACVAAPRQQQIKVHNDQPFDFRDLTEEELATWTSLQKSLTAYGRQDHGRY